MTLLQIRNALVSHLSEHDTVTPEDFGSIELPNDLQDHREALIRTVLADLCEAGMLRALGPAGEPATMWVLTSPLGAAGQEVGLSLPTCAAIADEINAYKDTFDRDDWPTADALSLGEPQILMLLTIIGHIRSNEPDAGVGPGEHQPAE